MAEWVRRWWKRADNVPIVHAPQDTLKPLVRVREKVLREIFTTDACASSLIDKDLYTIRTHPDALYGLYRSNDIPGILNGTLATTTLPAVCVAYGAMYNDRGEFRASALLFIDASYRAWLADVTGDHVHVYQPRRGSRVQHVDFVDYEMRAQSQRRRQKQQQEALVNKF